MKDNKEAAAVPPAGRLQPGSSTFIFSFARRVELQVSEVRRHNESDWRWRFSFVWTGRRADGDRLTATSRAAALLVADPSILSTSAALQQRSVKSR
ncbi:hypothetical protein EYF80_034767 [Liparis tanakae]|uniref:Uncharacterized protein n=1 Tax=Liparis tanakae TaxID=230148 RepID=A0A4Z2GP27_9TELE|nr:hypothetical protein EYF80_034767 [Liparis tanakae]